jgi:Pretoxin HINT domain/Fibronectin type III domain
MKKLLSLLLLFVAIQLKAQTDPVQVTAQLLPPYSLIVSEYYAGTTPKINLLLLNRDLARPTITVRLRMTIESQSVKLRTKDLPATTLATFTLTAGVPVYVSNTDLTQYFNAANLDFNGISASEYQQSGKLPEGFYTFCFEAIEVQSNIAVSRSSCAFAWMTLSDPPLLNIPSCGEEVAPINPQNIVFNWTPRHMAAPNAAFLMEYQFSITEINDALPSPESAFFSGTPLYTGTTAATTFLYGPGMPQLQANKRYAWRVRAVAKQGGVEQAMFKNNGYSQVCWFTYRSNCDPVTGISATVQGTRATIEWQANTKHLEYKVQYRMVADSLGEWFTTSNTIPRVAIYDLKASKQYEYRVGASCEYGFFNFSEKKYFTTGDSSQTFVAACGIDGTPTSVAAGTGLTTMSVPDTIRAGDFTVRVTEVTGSNGNFSGKGYTSVPWLAGVKVGVEFTSITVNSDHKLTAGVIKTTYDPQWNGIFDVDGFLEGGGETGHVVTGLVTTDYKPNVTITNPNQVVVTSGTNGSSTITINTPGGSATYTAPSLPATIQDNQGNIYTVNKPVPPSNEPTVTQSAQNGGQGVIGKMNPKQLDGSQGKVEFMPPADATKMTYAFDAWKDVYAKSSAFASKYERINGGSTPYYVAAKAIAPGKPDIIRAKITLTDASLVMDSVQFISGKGVIFTKTATGTAGEYNVSLVGGPADDAQEIYACYKQSSGKTLNLGKLFVAAYGVQNRKLVLVPVNGAEVNKDSIANTLNRVYGKVCVNWEVSLDANFVNDSWDAAPKDGKLQVDGSNFWSDLTSEMKDLNTAYRSNRAVEKSTVYLFVLNQAATMTAGTAVLGDMPRGRQFGYLFSGGGNGGNLGKTAAHEVGHGVFSYKHIFDYKGFTQGLQEIEDVMDYPSGQNLTKFQWDVAHDPAIVIGAFQNDEGGMYRQISSGIPNYWRDVKNRSVSFLAPNKKIVCLPQEATQAYFTFGIGEYGTFPLTPTGVLKGFQIKEGKDSVDYWANFSGTFFNGYKNKNGQMFAGYASKDSLENQGVAYLHLPTATGFRVYKLNGLPYSYVSKADNPTAIINLLDVSDATIQANADSWTYKEADNFEYNKGMVEYGVSSTSFNPHYASTMAYIDTAELNTQSLLIAKITEYRMVYPEVFDRMTTSFNDWSRAEIITTAVSNTIITASVSPANFFLTTSKEQLIGGYFEYQIVKNNWFDLPPNVKLAHFIVEFRKLIDSLQYQNAGTIALLAKNGYCPTGSLSAIDQAAIWSTQPNDIMNAINCISIDTLSKICSKSRATLIARILDAGIVNDPLEQAIYKLMWTCKKGNDRAEFLLELTNIKNSSNKYILKTLITAVDDRTLFMGKNFNTMIMNFILSAYNDLRNSNLPFSVSNIQPFTSIDTGRINNLIDDLSARTVSYNYVSVTKRLFKSALLSICSSCAPIIPTDTKSVVDFSDVTNILSYENKTLSGFVPINSTASKNYSPLDPIVLNDKAKLLDIYDQSGSGFYMPAIMLYFLEMKADAKSVVESIQTGFDIAMLAIPGTQGALVYKLMNYADKLCAVSDMLGSATAQDYPQFSHFMHVTSGVLGVSSIGSQLTIASYKGLNSLAKSVGLISKTDAAINVTAHEKALGTLFDDIDKLATSGSSVQLTALMGSAGKEKELLINLLELEKHSAAGAGRADIVAKLDRAIQRINLAAGGIAQLKTVRVKNIIDRLVAKNLLNKDGSNIYATATSIAAADQIAHITNAELYIDKIDNLSSLGPNAKLEQSINDADFFKTGTPESVNDDLLFFSDEGKIKCITGANCFIANTPVQTKQGMKNIQNITTGDTVNSYNEITKRNMWQRVTNVFKKTADKLQKLVIGRDTLYCTPEHKFYTGKRWVTAAALSVGMLLNTHAGSLPVQQNLAIDTSVAVYNFTVEETHTYYVGSQLIVTHNDCEKLAAIITSLESKGVDFVKDFKTNQALLDKFVNGQIDVKVYELLHHKPILRTNEAVLAAVSRIRKNPKFSEMGLTDAKLGLIEGFGHSGVQVAYLEMVDDLDALGIYIKSNRTTLQNFEKRIDELASSNAADRQGTLGVVKEILENPESYKNKALNFEKTVKNADGNSAYIDIYTNSIPPKMIERKWLTIGGVNQTDFIREFVKRDLFNAADISQIVWSIKGNKLTKAQVVGFLSSADGRLALNQTKIIQLFDDFAATISYSKQINTVDDLIEFCNSNNQWYNQIFK